MIFGESTINWRFWVDDDYILWTRKDHQTMITHPIQHLWPALRYNLNTLTPHSDQDVKSRVVPATIQVQAD